MTTPIVAGADGTRASLRAVSWAAGEAALRHLPLHVVNGFGIPDAFYGEILPPKGWLEARKSESEALVREAVTVAEQEQPRLTTEQESSLDAPIPLLIRRSEGAKMIVVGSAGRGVLGDLLVGSTAAALAAHAKCPVAVIRGDEHRDGPVVVGVDGSEAGESAVAFAFEEASLRGLPLIAVHAWHDGDAAQVFAAARAAYDYEPLRDAETRVLAEVLAGWQEKFPDVQVDRVVEEDRPRQRLLDWSTKASLIVVGSRGRGGFTGLLLGSVSQALVEHAGCPVLVARPV
ncbi:universal stress protein [Amycolatopsis alkalitolerans]|uniref:Universal stress protein n=1 Tax=Amycolatopsis alkalitolerans TaxID=2547244 RepID=A0A5C4M2B7_9PSEU|nr:universal stress protein [Amycolatopsis alkalitolerans]TNC24816.1 universal stress protein [Amycolatopsis alkalitolerans]